MKQFRLGIQMYSVRDAAAQDLAGTFAALAEMGYDGVELAGLCGHSAKEVREMAAAAGLEIISAHIGTGVFRSEGIEQTVTLYRELGCRYIAVPYLGAEERPNAPTFGETAELIKAIAAECKKQGLTLLYHNHDFEFARVSDGRTCLEVLYGCAPEDQLQTELDTCWAHIVGEDPAAILRRYANRAPLVHLKDYRGDYPAEHYVALDVPHTPAPDALPLELQPVGYGVQDIPAVIAAAEEAGTEWLIVEQDSPAAGDTEMGSAAKSAAYLKTLLGR